MFRNLEAGHILSQVVVSNIFIFTPILGENSHFDEHIFQMGWFNHQLVVHQAWNFCNMVECFRIVKTSRCLGSDVPMFWLNRLGCDIGGAKELRVIYFPTNWGAKEPQNLPNHRVVG